MVCLLMNHDHMIYDPGWFYDVFFKKYGMNIMIKLKREHDN